METIEREKTYLASFIPNLESCEKNEMMDIYIPDGTGHPNVRIRKQGDRYMITKKIPTGESKSTQSEQTIPLTETEFTPLSQASQLTIRKTRYYYPYNGQTAEIDVFDEGLKGLVLVDFEFNTQEEMNAFNKPDFCLVDITEESFIAGGLLAGKNYEDIEERLATFGYSKLG